MNRSDGGLSNDPQRAPTLFKAGRCTGFVGDKVLYIPGAGSGGSMNATCESAAITLRAWADAAQPGEQRIYFTGFLARSIGMNGLARAAWELHEAGAIHLFQQRIGPEAYAYIAQRRR